MKMGICAICGKTRPVEHVETVKGRVESCAGCAEKRCPACKGYVESRDSNSVLMDIAFMYTDSDGSTKHVQDKRRVHGPNDPDHNDPDHQDLHANPATFLRTRREQMAAAMRTTTAPQPIQPPTPRLVAVPEQTVAP